MPKILHLTGNDNPKPAKLTNRGPAGLVVKLKPNVAQLGNGQTEKLVITPVANGKINNIRCEGEVVDIASLLPDPNNARLHPDRNMAAIKDSLRKYGQMEPLVIREQNRMIAAGNGRHKAMKEMGWTRCAVTSQPMTDEEFVGFAIADNRTAELARWDHDMQAKLQALHPGAFASGWTDDEILTMCQAMSPPTAEELWQGMPEFLQEDQSGFGHVVVHFRTEADFLDFLRIVGQERGDVKQKSIWHPKAEVERFADKRWIADGKGGNG